MPQSLALRAVFAARLIQARQMRGLSQRALGDRMGLGKEKGSSRINRYEHQITAISFEGLVQLAEALDVPPAYLLASTPEMADALLALAAIPEQQGRLAKLLDALRALPEARQRTLIDQLLKETISP